MSWQFSMFQFSNFLVICSNQSHNIILISKLCVLTLIACLYNRLGVYRGSWPMSLTNKNRRRAYWPGVNCALHMFDLQQLLYIYRWSLCNDCRTKYWFGVAHSLKNVCLWVLFVLGKIEHAVGLIWVDCVLDKHEKQKILVFGVCVSQPESWLNRGSWLRIRDRIFLLVLLNWYLESKSSDSLANKSQLHSSVSCFTAYVSALWSVFSDKGMFLKKIGSGVIWLKS